MSTIALSLYRACARQLAGRGLRRFSVVNRLNDWVLCGVKTRKAKVGGHVMYLDPRDSLNLSLNEVYEPFETELIESLVREGDNVLDIGANIGYYTLIFARKVGISGRVFAFEPDPDNFALLKKNVESNGYKNVVLVNAALSDQAGTLRLYLSDENRGDNRIYSSGDERRSVDVAALVADDYLAPDLKPGEVNFVKIDVQGAEGRVLLGMKKILRASLSCKLIFEFWPQGLSRAGNDPCQILALLNQQGFDLQIVDQGSKQLLSTDPDSLIREFTIAKDNQTNLLALRPIREPAFAETTT